MGPAMRVLPGAQGEGQGKTMRKVNIEAPYPFIRNWEARCLAREKRVAFERERDDALFGLGDNLPEEEASAVWVAICAKYNPDIEHLRRVERSLMYPEANDDLFCALVSDLGVGAHVMPDNQVSAYRQYFEADESQWQNGPVYYCRAAGYLCELSYSVDHYIVAIQEI